MSHSPRLPTSVSAEVAPRSIFDRRLDENYPRLPPTGQRVARFLDQNRLTALSSSAADIAAAVGSSDATVIRTVQALGFESLQDLRQALVASLEAGSTPADNMRRTTDEIGDGVERAVGSVIETHLEALQALADPALQSILVEAIRVLNTAARTFIFGIGPSAALSEYVALLMTRHGRRARVLNASGIGLVDQMLELRSSDALLILAYGRTYREILLVFREAKRLRIPIVLITDSLEAKLARQADVVVPARRGKQGRVAMHGVTVIVLEAIVLGLAVADAGAAMVSLSRLSDLRAQLLT